MLLKKLLFSLLVYFYIFSATTFAASVAELLEDARSYRVIGEYKTAVIQLKNALQQDAKNVEARLLLGQIYLELGDGASAEKELLRARDLGAARDQWQVPMARVNMLLGRFTTVIEGTAIEPDTAAPMHADLLFLRGQAHLARGEPEQASQLFNDALAIQPEHADALLGKARLAILNERYTEAQQLAEQALSHAPDSAMAWLTKAELLRFEKKREAALQAYERVLAINPNDILAMLGKAAVYIDLEKVDYALELVSDVQKKWPDHATANYLHAIVLFRKEQHAAAAAALALTLRQAPSHLPSHLLMGRIRYQLGQLNQAEEHLRRYVISSPNNLAAIKLLGATLLKRKQAAETIKLMEAHRDQAGEDAQYLALLGSAYLSQARFNEGLKLLETASALAPDLTTLHTQLAIARTLSGDSKAAIDALHSAADLGEELIQSEILATLIHLRDANYNAALTAAQKMAKRLPDNPVAHNLIGSAYLGQNASGAARQAFAHAATLDPDFTPSRINLGYLDKAEGKLDAAQQNFMDVLRSEPDSLPALLGLAELAAERNDPDRQIEWLEKARTRAPQTLEPLLALIDVYLQTGKPLVARRIASDMMTQHAQHPQALAALARVQLDNGEDSSAIKTLRSLTEIAPDSPTTHMLMARAHAKRQELSAARASLQQVLSLQNDNIPAYLALARLELQAGELDKAQSIADQLKTQFAKAAAGYEIAGDIAQARGTPEAAAQAYVDAYAKRPSAELALKAHRAFKQSGKPAEAVKILERWLTANPADTDIRTTLAMTHHGAGRVGDAIEQYQQLLHHDADNVLVLNNLAWLHQEKGSRDVALKYAEQAYSIADATHRAAVLDTYGWLLVQNGQHERGLSVLSEAVNRAPHDAETRYHRAVALHKVGKVEQARNELSRLVKEGGSFPSAAEAKLLLEQL